MHTSNQQSSWDLQFLLQAQALLRVARQCRVCRRSRRLSENATTLWKAHDRSDELQWGIMTDAAPRPLLPRGVFVAGCFVVSTTPLCSSRFRD